MLMAVHVQTRDNAIVNRLNKTKIEKEVDHESDRQERLRLEGRKKKVEVLERVCHFFVPFSSSSSSCSLFDTFFLFNLRKPNTRKRDGEQQS